MSTCLHVYVLCLLFINIVIISFEQITFDVKFAILQFFRAAPGKGRLEFEASITNLFSSIIGTMTMDGDTVLPLQVQFMYYLKF